MKIIEKGKGFQEVLSVEDLSNIQGGALCIRYKACNDPSLGAGRETTCGILIGNPSSAETEE